MGKVDYEEYACNKVVDWFEEVHNLVVDTIEYRDTDWVVSQLIERQEMDINIFLSYCKARDIEMTGWFGGFEMNFPQDTIYFYDYSVENGKIYFKNLASVEYIKNKILERMKEDFTACIVTHGVFYCIVIENSRIKAYHSKEDCNGLDYSDFDIFIEIHENPCQDGIVTTVKMAGIDVTIPYALVSQEEMYYIYNFSDPVEEDEDMRIIKNNDDEITHVIIRKYIFTSEEAHDIYLNKRQLKVLQEAFGFSYIVKNFTVTENTFFYTAGLAEVGGKLIPPEQAFKTVELDREKDTHKNDIILYRSHIDFGIENGEFNVLPITYLQVTCPSTGNIHYLPVPPETKTCREGLAFSFQVEDYNPKIES